jgi:hypothetical protein
VLHRMDGCSALTRWCVKPGLNMDLQCGALQQCQLGFKASLRHDVGCLARLQQ